MSRIDRQHPGMRREPDSSTNRTDLAFVGYGISTTKAVKLRKRGYTVARLKQMKRPELRKLRLNKLAVDNILGDGRPPPPTKNLIEVLYANRFTCCVCRRENRGVIVHHIKKWTESRDHRVANLSVLCTLDHAKVHTRSELTQNLDPVKLCGFKRNWEAHVAEMETRAILNQSREHHSAWVYFNHQRLFELAAQQRVAFRKLNGFAVARRLGLCNKDGVLLVRSENTGWMYSDSYGRNLYSYVRDVLHAVLKKLTVANISDDLERGVLSALLSPGDYILVQGLHTFARQNEQTEGPGQTVDGVRKANKVIIEFTLDRFEATSSSAHGRWVSGRVDVSSIVRVGTITSEAGKLRIQGTVLAIAMGFSGLKTREYSTFPYRLGVYRVDDDFDEDDDNPFLDDTDNDD
ncbi:HNH endonuclease [Bradyrhizobium sp. CCGUVB1N3]|uniref:HNH endonuclease signature motif containing protein n=1 Tax=Bradyrhizobium sp. CCGUVB1N3 TaxID=2949629 RepID=UPI0020B1A758|nr:HNH endonuclease signature motif containing protein [Bradyrhizobium sp. CCGUVB1N3]MCP3477631.1 HNH endonuclease [Bradyrhizobium sp. CCGUVB1N3]